MWVIKDEIKDGKSIKNQLVVIIGEDVVVEDGINIEAVVENKERQTITIVINLTSINITSKIIINQSIKNIFILATKNTLTLTNILVIIYKIITNKI